MSYIDLIIKYLSGDLSREEAASFERELESNHELKESFEEHRAAFELIRDQLQKRDDKAFQAELQTAMNHEAESAIRKPLSRIWWYIPPAVASFLAILFILFPQTPNIEKILSSYLHPEKDPLVLAFIQDTRGEPEPGIIQYRNGNFQQSMELLSVSISQGKEDKLILLYYLLSAIELDRQGEVFDRIGIENPSTMDLLDQSICWYTTLGLLKSNQREEALEILHPLTKQEGPYQSDARKLEKILLK
jgi:hypothetical protein